MTYDDRERERLRRGLAVLIEETPVAPDLAETTAIQLRARSSGRTPITVFAIATAAVMVTFGTVVLLQIGESGEVRQAEQTVPVPTTSGTVPALAPGELPYVVSTAPGWTISYVERSDGDLVGGSGEYHHATIQFSNGSIDAELNVDAGASFESLIADREADGSRIDDATVWGTPVVVVQGEMDTDHSALWALDTVVFEFRALLDEHTFRTLLASLAVVDHEEWVAALPGTVVTDRSAAVTEYLADIPLPAGFDATSLQSGPEEDWYQVGADVVAAVTCAWIEQWIAAKADQDQAGIDQAVDAMATSREWDVLTEMSTEGDFSLAVFEYADAIAGDGTVVGGRVLTVEESYRQAFGCR